MMQNKSIKSNKSKIVYDEPKSSKYFQKDPNTGLSKCKICWAVIQAKDNTGLLRLHLQQVHKMNAVKIYDPFVQPKLQKFNPTSIPIPILPNVPKFAQKSKQIRPTLPNSNSSNPRHNDWLNPFFQLVSDPSEEQIEQDKDQVKYMMHCTQFTDLIKYLEYNRYMDEQLNDIRQQLGQLPNLYKLPAMVTLMEKQQDNKNNGQIQEGANQLNKDNKDSQENKNNRYIKIIQNKIQKNIKQLRQKYRVKEWLPENNQLLKNIKDRKMSSQQQNKQNNQIIQILSQSNTNKQNTPQKPQSVHNKNNTIQSLPNIDFSKNQQQLYYQLVKYNGFNIIKIENEYNQTAYVLCQNRMKQIYAIYGDSLCFLDIRVEGYVILIAFVENWRLNMEVVGVIIVKNLEQNDVKKLIQACLMQYFNVLKLPFPKSITIFCKFCPSSLKQQFQKFLNLIQYENTVQVTQYNIINQQQNPYQSEAQEQINKKQQKLNTAYNNLKTRLSKIYNKYCKINGRLGRLQIQLLNIDQLYKQKQKDYGYDAKNKQLLKHRQFVGKKYKGFFNNYRNEQWNQLYKHIYNKLQYNLQSLPITNIISLIFCQLQLYHKSQKNKQLQNMLKITQKHKLNIPANIVSPNLLNQLYQIQKLSQNIVILKHISPTYIQVFTVIPIQQKYSAISGQQITQPQCSSCRVYKNTVLFDEIDNYWVCNCQKIVELGVPCCHLTKIIGKMKGSLQYYIHQRWKPSEIQLRQLQVQISQITGMGNNNNMQQQQIQQIQEIQLMRQQIDIQNNIQIEANQQIQQNIEVLPQQNKDIIEIQRQKNVENVKNEPIQVKDEDLNPQKLLQ